MKLAHRHRAVPHIPFISLADIAWQIIIFFLVAATFITSSALKVDVPGAAEKASGEAPKPVTLQASEATLSLDGQAVEIADLKSRIAKLLEGRKTDQERAVVVEGRDDLSFQRDVEIMYAIQQAGGVLVMTDDEVAPAGPNGGAP